MNITGKLPVLAIIVNSPPQPENIGKIVLVTRVAVDKEIFSSVELDNNGAQTWVVSSIGSPLTWKDYDGVRHLMQERPYSDACLREIKGDETDITTETESPINEKVLS